MFGICRGMQLMNVALGGTLSQHVPDDVGHDDHRRIPGSFDGADHDVRLAAGSLAARAAGEETHATKSTITRALRGSVRVSRSPDGPRWTSFPRPSRRRAGGFVLGVQWHPEADEQSR